MKKRYIALIAIAVLTVGGAFTAYALSPAVHAGSPGEAPELGVTGRYGVGTLTQDFLLPNRTQITASGALTGSLAIAERKIAVRFWYPATLPANAARTVYRHEMQLPGKDPVTVSSMGIASSGAAAQSDGKFPLIIMSHGYGAWSTHYSNLGEHLASMGYVVASIDHADQVASGVPSLILSFANVLSDRAQDQRQILEQISIQAQSAKDGFLRETDVQNVGLIGYSMGGYGALSSAGAPYDYSSEAFARLPEQSKKAMQASAAKPAAVKAVVAIAPWGGAPDARAWNAEGLAKMDKPLLIIAGNQDDIVNFKDGISWLFGNLKSSDRHMLVYREARHNIAGNAFDTKDIDDFATLEFLREPVWRTDRINAINQHFVTAFFDLKLKGDASKAAYLALPAANSNDSVWPVGFGEQLNGERAGAQQKDHWRGFQRRWAVGLEMHHKSKGE